MNTSPCLVGKQRGTVDGQDSLTLHPTAFDPLRRGGRRYPHGRASIFFTRQGPAWRRRHHVLHGHLDGVRRFLNQTTLHGGYRRPFIVTRRSIRFFTDVSADLSSWLGRWCANPIFVEELEGFCGPGSRIRISSMDRSLGRTWAFLRGCGFSGGWIPRYLWETTTSGCLILGDPDYFVQRHSSLHLQPPLIQVRRYGACERARVEANDFFLRESNMLELLLGLHLKDILRFYSKLCQFSFFPPFFCYLFKN